MFCRIQHCALVTTLTYTNDNDAKSIEDGDDCYNNNDNNNKCCNGNTADKR